MLLMLVLFLLLFLLFIPRIFESKVFKPFYLRYTHTGFSLSYIFVYKILFQYFFLLLLSRLMLAFSNYLPIFHFIYFISFKCVSTLCVCVCLSCLSQNVCAIYLLRMYYPNWNWFTDKDLFLYIKDRERASERECE